MRVIIVAKHLRIGGAERQSVNLANGLCGKKGVEVCVLTMSKTGALLEELNSKVRVLAEEAASPGFVSRVVSLLRAARRFKPDVIYTRITGSNLATALAGRLCGAKVVIAEMNNPEARMQDSKHPRWRNILVLQTARTLASRVVANSKRLAEATEQILNLNKKPHVIYNGIDTEMIERLATESAEHPWIQSKTAPLVVSVGRLVKQKDYQTLIDVFAILKKTTDARLILVGGGELKEDLEKHIKTLNLENTVSLAGERKNPHPFTKAADVYVSSSKYEGFSNSILEAMVQGKAVVSTDHPFGANEMIEDGKSGLLVPVGDAEKMAEAILQILQNPELAGNLSREAKAKAREFTIEKMVSKYEKLFRELR